MIDRDENITNVNVIQFFSSVHLSMATVRVTNNSEMPVNVKTNSFVAWEDCCVVCQRHTSLDGGGGGGGGRSGGRSGALITLIIVNSFADTLETECSRPRQCLHECRKFRQTFGTLCF